MSVHDEPTVSEEPGPFCPDSCDHWDTGSECPVETVSDGEREGMRRAMVAALIENTNVPTEDAPGLMGQEDFIRERVSMFYVTDTCAEVAAGYRKAPVVSVEDVARAVERHLLLDIERCICGCDGLRSVHIATAVLALLDPPRDTST